MDNNTDVVLVGINTVIVAGTVDSPLTVNKTGSGIKACTFLLRITEVGTVVTSSGIREQKRFDVVVRINSYGRVAEFCSEKVSRGSWVVIRGELTNRMHVEKNVSTVDVKARHIIVVPESAITNVKLEGIKKIKEINDNE